MGPAASSAAVVVAPPTRGTSTSSDLSVTVRRAMVADSHHGPCRTLSTTVGKAVAEAPRMLVFAMGPGRSLSATLVSALVPLAVDHPNSSNGTSRRPGPRLGLVPGSGGSGSFSADVPSPILGPSHSLTTLGCRVAHANHRRTLHTQTPPHSPCNEDPADAGLHGCIIGSGSAVDGAGSGPCACTTFVDPWSGPGGAELDDACASDEPVGLSHVLRYSAASFSNSSSPRFPRAGTVPLRSIRHTGVTVTDLPISTLRHGRP
jgi:hypothetical protein